MNQHGNNTGLGKYFLLIRSSRCESLKLEKELALYHRIKKGDKIAEHKLILANLRFVVSVAKNYQNQGISLEDLISIGNMGLIKAARKFDARKNFKFISYAVWWIRQAILQAISEQSRITKIPLNQTTRIRDVRSAIEKLAQKYHRMPLSEEISEETGLTVSEVEETIKLDCAPLSMDQSLRDGSNTTLIELLSDGIDYDISSTAYGLQKIIAKAFRRLSEREKKIITMYFGLNGYASTLEEIGKHLNLTRERVRQLKERAIKSLRKDKLLFDITR